MGLSQTVEAVKVTFLGMAILARSPIENKEYIGGPIRIVQIAGDFAETGIKSFLFLMAMLSVNLGVLNLLPIPVLDGGHIFFLCVEAIKGSPLSWKKMEFAQMVGLALLLFLMLFVTYNDIMRYVPN
jgi:regulator of sigma E protease